MASSNKAPFPSVGRGGKTKHVLIIGGLLGVIGLALYPITIYPMQQKQAFQKEQRQTTAEERQLLERLTYAINIAKAGAL